MSAAAPLSSSGTSGPAAPTVLNAYFAAIREAGHTPGRDWDRELNA